MRTSTGMLIGILIVSLLMPGLPATAQTRDGDSDRIEKQVDALLKKHMQKVRKEILRDVDRLLGTSPDSTTKPTPSDTTKKTRTQKKRKAGYIGVYPQTVDEGVKLSRVIKDLPAAKAGLKSGDIIIKFDNTEMVETTDLMSFLGSKFEGDVIVATYLRGGEISTTKITLAGRPKRTGGLGLPDIKDSGEGLPQTHDKEFVHRPMPVDAKELDNKMLRALSSKVGTQVNWISSLDEALAEAKKTNRPILWCMTKELGQKRYNASDFRIPGSPTYDGIDYDVYIRMTMFSYPSTVDLLNTKFIPLRCRIDSKTAKKHGIVRFKFIEPGFLLLSPEGEKLHVIDRIATYSEQFFYTFLQSVLAEFDHLDHPSATALALRKTLESDAASIEDVLSFGDALLRSGELQAADQFLSGFATEGFFTGETLANYHLLQAKQNRLSGDRNAALLHVENGLNSAGENADLNASLLTESVNLMLLDRAWEEALLTCEAIRTEYASHPAAAEAMYRTGQIFWLQKREREAQKEWKTLCQTYPDSPFAGCAAFYLFGDGPLIHSMEVLHALPKQALRQGLASNTQRRPSPEELPALRRQAATWLATEQRSTGEWNDSPYEFMGAQHRPNTHMAITALAAASLVESQNRRQRHVAEAINRADEFIRDHRNLGATPIEKVYAYSYMMLYHCKRIQNNMGTNKRDLAALQILITKIGKHQSKTGEWGHEYYNPFVSGTALYMLSLAKDVGADVPKSIIETGAKRMADSRGESGAWGYMFSMPATARAGAGRTPLCELSLYANGFSTQEKLVSSLENFFKFKDDLERIRQYDFHADQFQNGGFFFYHDLWPVSEAIRHIEDPAKREQYNDQMLEMMLTYPEIDGSWVDSMNIGKGYGTAMSLLIMNNLKTRP